MVSGSPSVTPSEVTGTVLKRQLGHRIPDMSAYDGIPSNKKSDVGHYANIIL